MHCALLPSEQWTTSHFTTPPTRLEPLCSPTGLELLGLPTGLENASRNNSCWTITTKYSTQYVKAHQKRQRPALVVLRACKKGDYCDDLKTVAQTMSWQVTSRLQRHHRCLTNQSRESATRHQLNLTSVSMSTPLAGDQAARVLLSSCWEECHQ